MGGITERTFLTSLLALDTGASPEPTITVALGALMVLARARYGRAELHHRAGAEPMVLVSLGCVDPDEEPSGGDALRDVFDSGFGTARLELRSRRPGVELTFRERHLFELLFQAMGRLTERAPSTPPRSRSLHEATREFQARLVANALQRARGNVARAARELKVTRAYVYKLIRAAGMKRA
jgi:regulatory Fis family protein